MTTIAPSTNFTLLESLLLCQSVAQYGVANAPFEKISEDLRESVIVKNAIEYDNGRLDADALKALFLQLLKAEAKEHLLNALRDDATQNSNGSNKITEEPYSPQLSNIEDADEHAQLIPQLVDKLYLSYKDHAFREIQAEEERYEKLMASMRDAKVDVAEVRKVGGGVNEVEVVMEHEAGGQGANARAVEAQEIRPQEVDGRPQSMVQDAEQAALVPKSSGVLRAEEQPQRPTSVRQSPEKSSRQSPHPLAQQSSQQQDAAVTRPVSEPRAPELKIDSLLNPEFRGPLPPLRQHTSAFDVSRSPSQSAPNVVAPGPASPRAQTTYPPGVTSQYPPSHAQADPQQTPYQPVRPHIGGSPTFFNGQSSFNPPILPPIPGMAPPNQSSSHWSPGGSPVYNRSTPMSAQPRRLPSPEQMRRPSLPLPPVSTPALQQSRSSFQMPTGNQYGARQTPTYQPPNHRGGVMLPPFQVQVPQMPQNMAYQQMPRSNATPTMNRGLPHSQQFAMSEPRPWPQHLVENTFAPRGGSARTTPIRPGQFAAQNGTAFYSPGSNTGWKAGAALRRSQTVIRKPSLSPEREHPLQAAKSQTPGSNQKSAGKPAKNSTAKKQGITTKQTQSKGVPAKRGRPARDASNTPSTAVISPKGGRTRSHSTTSHLDESSFVSVASASKDEGDPATPAFHIEDTSEISETPTRAVSGRGRGRGRGRGGLSTVAMTVAATKKRKRDQSSMLSDLPTKPSPSPAPIDQSLFAPLDSDEPPTIFASRNFQRMTAPIMNNITSHKHASIFANPVRLKDAEGYTDIIRRPQDLKSIRAAIVAGSRAVAAATAGMALGTESPAAGVGTPTGASTPSGSSTSANASGLVRLPWSPALVPPLGIVNGAQLEQELCRMFANAVMFNPGNGGVVHDTREMFESVESAVAAWRATEKEVGELSMVEKSVKGKERKSVEEGESQMKMEGQADEDGADNADESVDELSAPVAVASGNKRRRTLV